MNLVIKKDLFEAYGKIMKKPVGSSNPDDILTILKFVKEILTQNNELMNFCKGLGDLSVQIKLNDSNKNYWFKVRGDEFEYGTGDLALPTETLSGSLPAIELILLDKSDIEMEVSNLSEVDEIMNACQDYWEIFSISAKMYRQSSTEDNNKKVDLVLK